MAEDKIFWDKVDSLRKIYKLEHPTLNFKFEQETLDGVLREIDKRIENYESWLKEPAPVGTGRGEMFDENTNILF